MRFVIYGGLTRTYFIEDTGETLIAEDNFALVIVYAVRSTFGLAIAMKVFGRMFFDENREYIDFLSIVTIAFFPRFFYITGIHFFPEFSLLFFILISVWVLWIIAEGMAVAFKMERKNAYILGALALGFADVIPYAYMNQI
ncbi:MAG: YIP1 family protein [Crocinitomicaceae bacterium]|nr:YIP1 family protein [Crocinitomicaceae bacterium]